MKEQDDNLFAKIMKWITGENPTRDKKIDSVASSMTEEDSVPYPMPEIHPKSGYAKIEDIWDDFKGLSTRAAMGDTRAMMGMFQTLRERLSEEYMEFEKKCLEIDDKKELAVRLNDYLKTHDEDRVNLLGSNMWLERAAIYGSDEAERKLESSALYRWSYFSRDFQIPAASDRGWESWSGSELRNIGLLDFTDDKVYSIRPLNDKGFYVASYYVGYDGPDETGFGPEKDG